MEFRMEIERKPDVDALLSRMSALTDAQRNYVLGVIDGTAAQIARQSGHTVQIYPAARIAQQAAPG